MKKIFYILLALFLICNTAWASYEVKGKGITSTLYCAGKSDKSKCNDEVTYTVDEDKEQIIRTAVVNADIKEGVASGLQTDNTVYQIVLNIEKDMITRKDHKNPQHIIKAIGVCGLLGGKSDGFETIVIGEDFITTSRSSLDYFVLYDYERVK